MTVFVNPNPEAVACEDKIICRGDSIQLVVTTHAQYSWSPTNTLLNPNSGTPIAFPSETTTYTVSVTDENGCTDTDEVTIFVNPPPTVKPIQLHCSMPGQLHRTPWRRKLRSWLV